MADVVKRGAIAGLAVAGISVVGTQGVADSAAQYQTYLETLRLGDFTKLAKLEFLDEAGNVKFSMDNNAMNRHSGAFIQSGSISCNKQNGARRTASITLANTDGDYDFAVNKMWYGQQIRLSEGMILPDGTEFYIPQGIFEIENPTESIQPGTNTITYTLVDKWANLDGTLFGNLEDVYQVEAGTNILVHQNTNLSIILMTARPIR